MTSQSTPLKSSWIVNRSPIYYGWVVWFAATLGLCATSPGQSFSVSLFIDLYILDFKLDRTAVSGLYAVGTFVAALALTWVGKRIDRHGNRRMSIAIAGLFAVALFFCAFVGGPLAILISFVAIRGLGQGSLGLVNSTAIAQWFQRRRGRVMSFTLVAFALFQRFYAPWMQSFIEANGWRAAWLLTSIGMALVVLPTLALLLRDRPEDYGLLPDGDTSDTLTTTSSALVEDNWTLAEVQRTPIFWAFIYARLLVGAWGTALIFHQVSLFESLGYDASVAANLFGQGALMAAGFTLLAGYLVDRLRPGVMITIQMIGLIVANVLMLFMNTPTLLFLYTVAFGAMMGIGSVFDGTVWVNLFGRKYQGAIRGFVATGMVMGTSVGPIVFGFAYDHLGGYAPSIWLGIILSLIAIVLALAVKMPVRGIVVAPELSASAAD